MNKSDSLCTSDSVKHYLTQTLLDSIIPFWYGTPWDFNGHTDVPGVGEIACGYFVSTTLKHLGFNINRYKCAQQDAYTISKIVCCKRPKKYLDIEPLLSELKKNDKTLYIVGLDYHVGYLYTLNNQVYFIHSDYFNNKVTCEPAKDSPAFQSNAYFVSELFNDISINKWIKNERFAVEL